MCMRQKVYAEVYETRSGSVGEVIAEVYVEESKASSGSDGKLSKRASTMAPPYFRKCLLFMGGESDGESDDESGE
jgi:hypothetical protein